MNKRPDVTAATRQRFLDAFCTLYYEKPLSKITVKEIAELAGYNRVTFYEYFKDAYDILDTLETEVFDNILHSITQNIQSENMLDNFTVLFQEMFHEKKDLAILLFKGSESSATIQRCKNRIMPDILSALGVQENDTHGRYLMEFYLSGIISVMCYWVTAEQKLREEELGAMIKKILEGGILPQLVKHPV